MFKNRLRSSSLSSLIAMALALGSVCCSQTSHAEPPKKGARTVEREVQGPVEINEEFFEPHFLGKGAPPELREAYTHFSSQRTHEARKKLEGFLSDNKSHAMAPRARFLLAYIEDKAGRKAVAAELYEEAAKGYPLLEEYALYYGGRAAYASKAYAKAIALCKRIGLSSQFGSRSMYLRGVALSKSGRNREAIEVLEAWMGRFGKTRLAGEVQLDLALAYEEAGLHSKAGRTFHTLRTRYPDSTIEKDAEAGVKRVSAKLGKKKAAKLFVVTEADRLARATALYDKHRSDQVVAEMDKLLGLKSISRKKGSKLWCDATWLRARAYTKLRDHRASSKGYEAFVKGCKRDARVIKALFVLGRAHWNIDEDAAALKVFERIWTDFPNHSYADDAVLYAARIHRGNDRDAASQKLQRFQVEHFPNGDMLGDANWYLFVDLYGRGKYKEALAFAKKVGKATGEKDLYTRGRLNYFQARAHEALGDKEAARAGFIGVARDVPMSYYALLALNRLKDLDASSFEEEIGRLSSDTGRRQVWTLDPPYVARDSGFKRGVELLRMGLFGESKAEFGGVRQRFPGKEDLLWVLTMLFDRAGAYHLSHDIPRREIGSFGTAYPVGEMRSMFELAYPRPFHGDVRKWASKRGLPEALVYAIMREESGFNPQIESWANAYGLMQLMVGTAQDMAKVDKIKRKVTGAQLLQPAMNVRLGTRYLQTLHEAYGNHPSMTIAGYNGGQGNVDRWLKERGAMPFDLWVEEIPFGQTRHYTKRVTMSLWIYQWLYGADAKKPESRLVELPFKLPPPSL